MTKDYQRYSGAGNYFLMIDNRDESVTARKTLVHELMKEEKYSGIDGVIFLEGSKDADFKMNYFNRDGSNDALCGNGLRCTVKYLRDNKISDNKEFRIEAVGNIYNAKFISKDEESGSDLVEVSFPPPGKVKLNFPLKIVIDDHWKDVKCSYVDVGSDHIVIFLDELRKLKIETLEQVKVNEFGRQIRMHKDLMPEGANVNFVDIIDARMGNIEIRTYERGVEAETLACGTGSISSAIVSYFLKEAAKPVNVLTRSQEILTVNFEEYNSEISNLTLTGPAERIE